jgi:hypothetical protein
VSLAGLLTPAEEQIDARTGQLRFDIGMLALRVTALTDWLAGHRPTVGLVTAEPRARQAWRRCPTRTGDAGDTAR